MNPLGHSVDCPAAPAPAAALPCPELLAPAGDWECVRAAVENGADAVYFGLDQFNARMRAQNFTVDELPRLMEYLHRRGVKGYVTFNILVFTAELAAAEQYVRAIMAAGVDAAIVQDVGACRLIRRLSPDFPIHASTQMTISNAAGLRFAGALGCSLVALARECSVAEIEKMQGSLKNAPPAGPSEPTPIHPATMPLEVFVHGALCVAYSGQCLTSESLGGRSANRGVCAQACRLPYELISDGQTVPLGNRSYLLSPRDLAGLEVLPELIRAGIHTFKIEGRLKKPEYVANITRIYRQALDRVWAALGHTRDPANPEAASVSLPGAPPDGCIPHSIAKLASELGTASRYDLEMAFSRGPYTGWMRGTNNQELVHARFGKKRGVYLGQVSHLRKARVAVRLEAPLKPGDGVVFDAGHPDQPEEGGRVYGLEQRGAETWLSFGRGDLDFDRLHLGDRLWKTDDPDLNRRLRRSFAGGPPRFQRPVRLEVSGRVGDPLAVVARDEFGNQARVTSSMLLAKAERQPLDEKRLREHLGRLSSTPFRLAALDNRLESPVILPVSELNRLRRHWVDQLAAVWVLPNRWSMNPGADLAITKHLRQIAVARGNVGSPRPAPELSVLVRNLEQLAVALQGGVQTVYCEFEDPKKYRAAVALARQEGPGSPPELWVAPPRITKPGEDWILKLVRSAGADGYLVRNADHLEFFAGARCVGDFSFNIANPLSAEYFFERFHLERVTASYDLNIQQLEDLLRAAPPAWFEVTLHQHTPMFHMEHCVFCAFLSTGTDYRNCGRPCDHHDVKLRDRVGVEHPVKADAGCRNTVFNGRAQSGAEHFERLEALGLRAFRIEFLNETPGVVAQTIAAYRQLLRHEITGNQLWRDLKVTNYLGVTRGPME